MPFRTISPLPLDSPLWASLPTAYGDATRILEPLAAILDGKAHHDDVWARLYDELCHQGTPHGAVYAVVPHLAGALARFDNRGFFWALRIAATAEARDEAEAPPPAYAAAIAVLRAASVAGLRERRFPDDVALPALLGDVGTLFGERAIAAHLERRQETFGDRVAFDLACPRCQERLVARVQPEGLFVVRLAQAHEEDDARPPQLDGQDIARRLRRGAKLLDRAYAGLHGSGGAEALAALARELGEHGLAAVVVALSADVTCPACREVFRLISAVADG
jgi:hypothetical protein